MTAIGYRMVGFFTAGIVVLSFLVAAHQPEAGDAQAGGIAGRIIFATVPPDEFFEPTDVVVYLTGEGLADAPAAAQAEPRATLLDQIDYAFAPRVLPIVAGTELRFHNGDSELHNIHTFAKGRPANRMFNRSQLPGSTFTETFEQPDSILVRCDIHSQMIAHILVLPNTFHTMPAEDGSYSLGGVPPGTYDMVAWHADFDEQVIPITVTGGETETFEVTIR